MHFIIGSELYLYEEFKELYHLRWNVEEVYKLLKSRVEIEQFTGRTSRSIYQDFYAKIFMMTLCAALSYPIAEKVKIEFKSEKPAICMINR
ncbi:MAG: transposase [Saprospiraceae bacterium]|nr:transposase [Saprospiraceae bacterium]